MAHSLTLVEAANIGVAEGHIQNSIQTSSAMESLENKNDSALCHEC